MVNGKVLEFVKSHWLGIASFIVACVAICCGIHRCSRSVDIDINPSRNRVIIQHSTPSEHGVKKNVDFKMASIFYAHESRILTNPLSNGTSKYVCWKIANLWFVQFWTGYYPSFLRVFEDAREFEKFYKSVKKSYRNEKCEEFKVCPVAGFRNGEKLPF